MVSLLAELLEELVRVGEVEVPGKEERAVKAGGRMDERMAEGFVAAAVGGVAQVAEEDRLAPRARAAADGGEQVGEGRGRSRFREPPGRRAGFGVEREDRRAGTVLPAVVLLFQQERERRPARIGRPRERAAGFRVPVAEPQQRHGAFVFDFVGHSKGERD
jgi:hypothetical protein